MKLGPEISDTKVGQETQTRNATREIRLYKFYLVYLKNFGR